MNNNRSTHSSNTEIDALLKDAAHHLDNILGTYYKINFQLKETINNPIILPEFRLPQNQIHFSSSLLNEGQNNRWATHHIINQTMLNLPYHNRTLDEILSEILRQHPYPFPHHDHHDTDEDLNTHNTTSRPQSPPSSPPTVEETPLNGTQKSLIEGTLQFIFETIAELEPAAAIASLQAMLEKDLDQALEATLEKQNVLDCVQLVRKILNHPYPQNKELFNLTPWSTCTTFNPDQVKQAIVDYINKLIEQEIEKQIQKLPMSHAANVIKRF